jgi:multiple antibiotic resistance protein
VNPIGFIKVLALTFVALFAVVNPIGDAPIFPSLTGRYSQAAQETPARKIAAYGFAFLAVSFLFGSEILFFSASPSWSSRLRVG